MSRRTGSLAEDFMELLEQKRRVLELKRLEAELQRWEAKDKLAPTRHWLFGFDVTDCKGFAYSLVWGIVIILGVAATTVTWLRDRGTIPW